MKSNYLILGATGSIGYAVTKELLTSGRAVTIVARSKQKALRLFGNNPALEIIEGDAQDIAILGRAVQGKKFIFHGINYPYHKWNPYMVDVTEKVIEVAKENKSVIVFPGNIYNFGNASLPITEFTSEAPSSKKGKLRAQIEAMMKHAAERGLCKVLIVRLPDFWGPNVTNDGIAPIFVNALKKKPMPFVVRTDIPHQLVYTPDAARVICMLMEKESFSPFEVFNYGGTTVPSITMFFEVIAKEANASLKITTYSRAFLSVVGIFSPVVRELKEMLYLYDNSVILDDFKVRTLYPHLQETPLLQAANETLRWFRENYV